MCSFIVIRFTVEEATYSKKAKANRKTKVIRAKCIDRPPEKTDKYITGCKKEEALCFLGA
jgi:hypothetical protein